MLATVLEAMVKLIVARTRPHLLLDEGVYEVGLLGPNEKSWRSFPSGHVAGSVALARSGHTLPSDLLAGALIGTAAETIVARLFPPG